MPIMVHTPNQSNSKTGVPPIFMNADGNALTAWSISGQTVQNGTPTPTAPIYPEFVGERTANLFDGLLIGGHFANADFDIAGNLSVYKSIKVFLSAGTYTFSWGKNVNVVRTIIDGTYAQNTYADVSSLTITNTTDGYVGISFRDATSSSTVWDNTTPIMLNTGSTAKPYEPFGYKLPVSCGAQTTPVYLGQAQTMRQIKKLALTGDEQWGEGDCAIGHRFFVTIPGAVQSDIVVGVRSKCSHLILVGTGETYRTLGAYTITSRAELFMTLYGDTRLADWKSWLAQQYAAGTPVTVWFVITNEQTGIVNEPLCKIGDYADTVASTNTGAPSIITSEGYQNLTVDTTVQPSNVSVSYNLPEFSECSRIYAKTDGLYSEVTKVLNAAGALIYAK